MVLHSGICAIMPVALQEYLPRIKDNDVLRAVEKNTSGSRPKELFEEVLEDVDKQWEIDRYCFGICACQSWHLLRQCSGHTLSSSFQVA